MLNRYKKSHLAVIALSLHSEGGDWRSIYFLAKHLELRGERVAMISPRTTRGIKQALAAVAFAPRVIVNGLSTLNSWLTLILCLLRSDIVIYLHETSGTLDDYQKSNPVRYWLLKQIIRRNPILCVSQQAERLYTERFGATRTHVVYECTGEGPHEGLIDQSKRNIVMVGSINERKGAELFSKVADLAADLNTDWQFHWVGSLATMNAIYLSENVNWHGWQWQPGKIVEQCDVFFLSSVDDPCPLAALEAMQQGLQIVAYGKTGTAEIIKEVVGCGVFKDYSADKAMDCLAKTLRTVSEPEAVKEKARTIVGVEAFYKRIEEAFTK